LPYLAIVMVLRYLGPARWWHSVVGLLASILLLAWVFVPQHLGFGVLPTPTSLHDISDLVRQARQSMQAEHAPLHSTNALRLLVAAALTGLVCLTDVLGVLLRRPLLAAAPLLEVLAVASATSSRAANPFWFAAAAVGFLLILLAGTRLQDRAWGPSVDGSAGRLDGGRRMAVSGIVAALIVPLLLPSVPTNLLARAAHHNGSGNGPGGGHGQIVLSSLASLRGSLQLPTPRVLFDVHVDPGAPPFYIRQDVDDQFDNSAGWRPSGSTFGDPTQIPLAESPLPISPNQDTGTSTARASDIKARFTIENLGGKTLPILSNPTALQNLTSGSWNSRTSSVFDVSLKSQTTYTEAVSQLNPTPDQLRAAQDWAGSGDQQLDAQFLQLPSQPDRVTQLADQLTSGLSNSFDKALAISDYFSNGKNGFTYSLSTLPDDGSNALVQFLTNKTGFCQQYAAAAAVLMRTAKLPARVVIGYTHRAPDSNGNFSVTTSDAHAWVEVYFDSIGWITFDPTPLSGSDTLRAVSFPWAPHPSGATASTAEPTANKGQSSLGPSVSLTAGNGRSGDSSAIVPTIVWQLGLAALVVLIVILAVVLGPRLLRRRQRRRRLDRARSTGNPEPLWQELAATATDRDALWPSTVTVGQVAVWLSRHGVDERGTAAVSAVANKVERDRYSAQLVTEVEPESIAALDQALTRWARRTDRRLSLLNRWLPKSLLRRPPRWHR
ncbi:MAG: transglutaminaseTgpA domain-containing protein, partial [Jatrophihabitans sp.]